MLGGIAVFIIFIAMVSTISYYYVKLLWYIVKSIKFIKLQKMVMENKIQGMQLDEKGANISKAIDKNDPMFG